MPSPIIDIPTGSVGKVQIIYDFCTEAEEAFLLDKIAAVGGDAPASTSTRGSGPTGAPETTEGSDTASAPGATSSTPATNRANKAWGWNELNGRRSMYWGGTLLPSSGSLVPAPFPPFMDGQWPDVLGRIAETGVYDGWTGGKGKGKERGANHCLVNEYLPGQGIMPHTDGPSYLPCTTTLSLGSHTVLCLRSKPSHLSDSSPSAGAAERSVATSSSSTPPESTGTGDEVSTEQPEEPIYKIDLLLPPRSLLILSSTLYSTYLHGIQPLPLDSSASLRGCANAASYWEWEMARAEAVQYVTAQGGELAGAVASGGAALGKEGLQEVRSQIEQGKGLERGRRVSLTCRRVGKVKKGLFKFG
ncbi:hypothetical protein JCM11641_002795 [Rhodosporidiobolus odoratus]